MSRGVIVAGEGFVEPQLRYPHYRLREDGVVTEFATLTGEAVSGACGTTVEPTVDADDGRFERGFEFVVVPGATALDRELSDAARGRLSALSRSASVFACVGRGVSALIDLGEVEGRLVTGPTELATAVEAAGGRVTGERVTVDGRLVTGRDTDALPFFVMAVRNALAIPQDADAAVRERSFQERARWSAGEPRGADSRDESA